MPTIHVSTCTGLFSAVNAKLDNETVSRKTLGKLTQIARGLYGVGNKPSTLTAMSKAPDFRGLETGALDISAALNIVKNHMKDSPAKHTLIAHLDGLKVKLDSSVKKYKKVLESSNPHYLSLQAKLAQRILEGNRL